jgi:exosortase
VPLVSLFFIYQQKERLRQTEQQASLTGLFVLLFALLLHLLGTVLYVFSVSGFSLFFLAIGLVLFLFGKEIAKIIWFALFFLVFMFPLPQAVISLVSFPLKIFAARAGVFIVRLFGVPVHGEGFNIIIPAGHLLVGNPCSGLRSLIAFLALGSVFAYMAPLSTARKWILFFLSVPIALLSNIVRVPILILVSHYWGLEAAAPDTLVHTGSGVLVYVLGFLLLLFAARVLEWRT